MRFPLLSFLFILPALTIAQVARKSTLPPEQLRELDSLDVHGVTMWESYSVPFDNKVQQTDSGFSGKGEYLYINQGERVRYGNTKTDFALGLRLYVVNQSDSVMKLWNVRGNLYPEALDRNGKWRALAAVESPNCGNAFSASPHIIVNPHCYWAVYIPVFKGTYKTKLRYTFYGALYSNEIDTYINEDQFVKQKAK